MEYAGLEIANLRDQNAKAENAGLENARKGKVWNTASFLKYRTHIFHSSHVRSTNGAYSRAFLMRSEPATHKMCSDKLKMCSDKRLFVQ